MNVTVFLYLHFFLHVYTRVALCKTALNLIVLDADLFVDNNVYDCTVGRITFVFFKAYNSTALHLHNFAL